MPNEIVKYQPQNALVKKADIYLAHLNALMPKKYAPDLPNLIPFRKGNLWGFCDRDKNIVIECIYQEVNPFINEISRVKLKNKYGFISIKNAQVANCEFDIATDFSEGFAVARKIDKFQVKENRRFLMNKRGETIVFSKYISITNFNDGFAKVQNKNGKYGFINLKGVEIIACRYDYIMDFSEGIVQFEINGKFGFVNKNDIEITLCKYDDTKKFKDGFAIVKLNEKFGIINKLGVEIVPCQFDHAREFNEGFSSVKLNNKWGFIDKDGCQVIPFKYDHSTSFCEDLAKVQINGEVQFIDKNGEVQMIISDYIYSHSNDHDFTDTFKNGLAVVSKGFIKDGFIVKDGFIDKKGQEIIACKYSRAETFIDNLARFKLNGKSGFINLEGIEIIANKYQHIGLFKDGLAVAELRYLHLSGYVDKLGNEYWED